MNAIFLASTLFFIIQADGVKRCYVCMGTCEHPLQIKDCHLPDTTDYVCKTSSFVQGPTFVRECQPNTLEIKKLCEQENKKGVSACYTCETDLCNDHNPEFEKENKISKFPESGVKKCYACKGDCDNPHEEICNIANTTDYLCEAVASIKKGVTRIIRRCIANTEKKKTFCKSVNNKKDVGCYTCDTDLCNKKDPINEVAVGAKKCYFCEGDCKELQEEICEINNYLCQAWSMEINGVTEHVRQCVPNTKNVKQTCQAVGLKKSDSCYNCHKDMCNSQAEIPDLEFLHLAPDEGSVQKCYACKNKCENPQEQTCHVKNYLCQESAIIKNGIAVSSRKCVPNTEYAKEACAKLNELKGFSCYTCNQSLCNNKFPRKEVVEDENVAETYSAPAMVLATLVSLFLTKL